MEEEDDTSLVGGTADESRWEGNILTDKLRRLWIKRRPKPDYDYVMTVFLCAVNPTSMALTAEDRTPARSGTVRRPLSKLFVAPRLVGGAKGSCKGGSCS